VKADFVRPQGASYRLSSSQERALCTDDLAESAQPGRVVAKHPFFGMHAEIPESVEEEVKRLRMR